MEPLDGIWISTLEETGLAWPISGDNLARHHARLVSSDEIYDWPEITRLEAEAAKAGAR